MATLYVSDLDGTLLGSDQKTSEYTTMTINEMVERGMMFSYATARSYETARKVTAGIDARIPVVLNNGSFVKDSLTGKILSEKFFGIDIYHMLKELTDDGIFPIVFSLRNGEEKFTFLEENCSSGAEKFLNSRRTDVRRNQASALSELYKGDIFYITCIEKKEKLAPFFEKYQNKYHCVFHEDIYTKEQWLEIMPADASKANAVIRLKELLQCDRVIVFGDGKNDIDMFEIADEAYAVNNAVDELKAVSTAVIDDNDSDGVAKWLRENAVF